MSSNEPYESLGSRIKFLREQWQQSLQEVSGTLEIDETSLRAIEDGASLPKPEILDMFISHFLLTEDQAQDLRDLAEDNFQQASDALSTGLEDMLMKQIIMYLPIDTKTIYTDQMNATVNNHGVVLQFLQQNGSDQPVTVSKLGMSREHAEKMIEVLQSTLRQHDQGTHTKRLPSPKEQN